MRSILAYAVVLTLAGAAEAIAEETPVDWPQRTAV